MEADPDTFVASGQLFLCEKCLHPNFTTYNAAYDHILTDPRHATHVAAIRLRYGSRREGQYIDRLIKVLLIPDDATEVRIKALASAERTISLAATTGGAGGFPQAMSIRNHNDNYKYNVQIVSGNVPAPAIAGAVAAPVLLKTRVKIFAPQKYGLGPSANPYCFLCSLDLTEPAPTPAVVLAVIAARFKMDWAEQHPGVDAPPPEVGWAAAAARCFLVIKTQALDLEVRFKLRNDGEVRVFYKAGMEATAQKSMWALVMGG